MCIYCDTNSKDWTWKKIPVNMGEFGQYEFTLAVTTSGRMELEFGEEGRDGIWGDVIKIQYCPYCGGKLGRRGD